MNVKTIKLGILSAVMSISFASCGQKADETDPDEIYKPKSESVSSQSDALKKAEEDTGNKNTADEIQQDEKKTGTATVHLVCAGDNLIHDNIYVDAQNDDGSYDFTKCYAPCKRLLEDADIAILNQETLVNDAFEPSTYPIFSTPTEDGDAVVDLGFNVISMSNNHVLDKGAEGLLNSLDYWDSKGVIHYGAYRDEEDSEAIRTTEVNGIKFAFLGYMEHTNGFYLEGEEGKVVYLGDTETVKRQIQEADKIADIVVVSCHYGTEIMNELNDMQISLTPQLVEWGADLIIGTQAHALSTCEYLNKPDGGQAFVYYGLGNFFSTMYDTKSLVGIVGDLDIVKNFDTDTVTIENVKAIPVISHFEATYYDSMWYNCAVYPMKDYTEELMNKNFMHWDGFNWDSVNRCLSYVPEEFLSIE